MCPLIFVGVVCFLTTLPCASPPWLFQLTLVPALNVSAIANLALGVNLTGSADLGSNPLADQAEIIDELRKLSSRITAFLNAKYIAWVDRHPPLAPIGKGERAAT